MRCDNVIIFSCVHQPETYVFMHSHNYFEMIYYVAGTGKSAVGDEIFSIAPGDIIIIPPNVPHDEKYFTKGDLVWCNFACEDGFLNNKTKIIKSNQIKDRKILDILERMKEESSNKEFEYQQMLNTQMSEILVLLERIFSKTEQKSHSAEIEYAKEFLKQNFQRKVNLEILSEQIGYSYDHFRHIFKKETLISPNQYLINIRILKAKELLEKTDLLVQEVAVKCGFDDVSRFIKVFKEETGFSPSKYKQIIHKTEAGVYIG